MSPSAHSPRRGETYVLVQMLLIAGIGLAPAVWRRPPPAPGQRAAGTVLLGLGAALGLWSARRLGAGLTPLPEPTAKARLTRRGPYAYVRHPLYSGVLLAASGWSLRQGHAGSLALTGASRCCAGPRPPTRRSG